MIAVTEIRQRVTPLDAKKIFFARSEGAQFRSRPSDDAYDVTLAPNPD